MSTVKSIAACSRRFVPAVLLAATATLSASALGDSAVACAEPREWDIGSYDQCWNSGIGRGFNDKEFEEHVQWCCFQSGGDWNKAEGKCQAPPAEAARVQPTIPPGVGTQTLEPVPPPVKRIPQQEITATFTPAPVG